MPISTSACEVTGIALVLPDFLLATKTGASLDYVRPIDAGSGGEVHAVFCYNDRNADNILGFRPAVWQSILVAFATDRRLGSGKENHTRNRKHHGRGRQKRNASCCETVHGAAYAPEYCFSIRSRASFGISLLYRHGVVRFEPGAMDISKLGPPNSAKVAFFDR